MIPIREDFQTESELMETNQTQLPEDLRGKTDQSLEDERGKTDEYLNHRSQTVED